MGPLGFGSKNINFYYSANDSGVSVKKGILFISCISLNLYPSLKFICMGEIEFLLTVIYLFDLIILFSILN